MNNFIEVYSDGGYRSSANLGAWAYSVQINNSIHEAYESVPDTTNNQMELTAVIKALEILTATDTPVIVHSDSKYVVDGITSWRYNWERNDWLTANKKPVANQELWKRLVELADRQTFIKFEWVKGHQNNGGMNDRVDALVNKAMDDYLKKIQ